MSNSTDWDCSQCHSFCGRPTCQIYSLSVSVSSFVWSSGVIYWNLSVNWGLQQRCHVLKLPHGRLSSINQLCLFIYFPCCIFHRWRTNLNDQLFSKRSNMKKKRKDDRSKSAQLGSRRIVNTGNNHVVCDKTGNRLSNWTTRIIGTLGLLVKGVMTRSLHRQHDTMTPLFPCGAL